MIYTMVRLVISTAVAFVGYQTAVYMMILSAGTAVPFPLGLHYRILGTIVGGLIGWLVGPPIINIFSRAMERALGAVQKIPTPDIIVGSLGLIVGMLVGVLATFPLPKGIPFISASVPLLVTFSTGYIGVVVAVRRREELTSFVQRGHRSGAEAKGAGNAVFSDLCPVSVLDTSVIIDGRIVDICRSGFITGTLIVPTFVLEELQHIADSADSLRRNRGRRGLDVLGQIQTMETVNVTIVEDRFDEVSEVDTKLIRAAQKYGAKILTNDYNLNKVAELQGVSILNINELANAVKPIALAGEEMDVTVIKEGKEVGQGVAYLDDGTMIVIDHGKKFIGETISVVVTSVLQTAAGRMIFAKPKHAERYAEIGG